MEVPAKRIVIFLKASGVWVLFAVLVQLPDADLLWTLPRDPGSLPGSVLDPITHLYSFLPVGSIFPGTFILLAIVLRNLLWKPHWWTALPVWALYTSWLNAVWPTSTAGHQLMGVFLFFSIPLALRVEERTSAARVTLVLAAFWILRLQLLLAYAATALHKLQGHGWVEGTAISSLASQPGSSLGWLVDLPLLAATLTYAVLAFQIIFPFAIWWRAARLVILIIGAVFHLCTALALGIPEMGMAFLVAYILWWDLDPRSLFVHRAG